MEVVTVGVRHPMVMTVNREAQIKQKNLKLKQASIIIVIVIALPTSRS